MHKEHFQAIKSLRCNKQILITKPDKESSFYLGVLESVYIKTQSPSCVDKKSLYFL